MPDQEEVVIRREYRDRRCPQCGTGYLQEAVPKSAASGRWDGLKSWFRCSAAPACDYDSSITGGREIH